MEDRTVIIRGYGDIAYPCICTFYKEVKESEAISVIENYLEVQTECKKERYDFEVRTADDKTSLFCYKNGEIYDDARGEE